MDLLVRRHSPAVTRLLWKFVRTPSDLEDLVQDTFLRMVRGLPRWRSEQPISHWILRIAANTGRDYCRRHAVRRRWMVEPNHDTAADGGGRPPAPEAPDPGSDPAARAAANEVKQLLERLPADDRAVLILHHLQGWDLNEIARQFGWTHTATKLRAWRARRRLRDLLLFNNKS